ncbi:MAG: HD domain-containing protein [Lachnospiraceae bacterium]|nr:HD domain-containing protein [Lachnospiraceae bacterium]
MLNTVYFILFVISIINIVALAISTRSQHSFYYACFFLLISLSCFGYLTISSARIINIALLGNVITYFGAAFLPLCFMQCVADLCEVKVSNVVGVLLFACSSVVFFLVWRSMNGNMLFYESITLVQTYGGSTLKSVKGPLYWIYPALLFIYTLMTIYVMCRALWNKKKLAYRNLFALVLLEVITVVTYYVEKLLNSPIELMNFVYIIDEFVLLVLIYRIDKYDVSESVAGSLSGLEEYGYMIFDNKLRYLAGNESVRKFFPEITHIKFDKKIDPAGNPIIETAVKWLKHSVETGDREPLLVSHNGRELKCTLRSIRNGLFGSRSGYLVELFDDTKQQRYMNLLANYNTRLENEVTQKLEDIKSMQDKIILGLSDIVESRDNNTGGHVKRTSEGVRIFMDKLAEESREFHFTKKYCENVIKAAPMHDLGKIAVDDQILRKPGRYTDSEFNKMKVHAGKGAEIVSKALSGIEDEEFLEIAQNIAHYHHEKWDGGGYPEGLAGRNIPLEARIMALADVFDALVSERCYKKKLSYDEAFEIIEESLGTHFDPELGRVFIKCRPELEAYYDGL